MAEPALNNPGILLDSSSTPLVAVFYIRIDRNILQEGKTRREWIITIILLNT